MLMQTAAGEIRGNCVDRACFHGGSENRGKVAEK